MKKEEFAAGLEGVVAGESEICYVDPAGALLYRGYSCEDLAYKTSFEEVAYLLLKGELPDKSQLATFTKELNSNSSIPKELLEVLKLLPKNAHPMDVLRTGVSFLGTMDKETDDKSHDANVRKAIRILAKAPTIMTAAWRIAHGEGVVAPAPGLSFAENLLYMLKNKKPSELEARALNISLILYAEHDYNASTFASRVTAATLSDIYAGITSAIGTLKGPLHGGANEHSMHLILDAGDPATAKQVILDKLAKKEKIMGFGHRVYKKKDSRHAIIKALAKELSEKKNEMKWYKISEIIEETMWNEKKIFPNVDFYSATVYYLMGIPIPLYTPIFVCSRITGWAAHIIEQHDNNRLIRPMSIYKGPEPRKVP